MNRANKNTDLESIKKAVHLARKTGIITQGFFIFGLEGETEETINETIRFAKELPLDKAQFLLLDILPGSKLWDKLAGIQQIDWRHRSYQEATWVPEGLSKEKLNGALGHAFRSFFFRPKQMLFLLRYLRLNQMKFVFRRIADFNILPFLRPKKGIF